MEPFLPPDEPRDNPPAKPRSNARKTLILWVILILMFWALYQLFSTGGRSRPSPAPTTWPITFLPILIIVGFFWYFRRRFAVGGDFNRAQEPALLALADGRPGEAARLYEELAKKLPAGQVAAVARANLGYALVADGRFDQAIAAYRAAEEGAGLLYGSDLRLIAAVGLARAYALAGELDAAERWARDARRRLQPASDRLIPAAQLRIAEAMLLARRGAADQARALLEQDWTRIEARLQLGELRVAWLLRAFLGERDVRAAGAAQAWLRMLHPPRRGQLDYLGAAWPEMRAFLEANELSAGR